MLNLMEWVWTNDLTLLRKITEGANISSYGLKTVYMVSHTRENPPPELPWPS